MRLRRLTLVLAAPVALAACAGTGSTSYPVQVQEVQAAYQLSEGLVNQEIANGRIPAAQAAIVQTAEHDADPVAADLVQNSDQMTLKVLLADAQTYVATVPQADVTSTVQRALLTAQRAVASGT